MIVLLYAYYGRFPFNTDTILPTPTVCDHFALLDCGRPLLMTTTVAQRHFQKSVSDPDRRATSRDHQDPFCFYGAELVLYALVWNCS